MRPEGVWKIINTNTERSAKRIGRYVVFPFELELGSRTNAVYIKQNNPPECVGQFLSTSPIQNIDVEDKYNFSIETINTTYEFEYVWMM